MSNGHLDPARVRSDDLGPGADDAALAEAFDELASRLQAGEAVGREEVRRRYPEHAEELLRLLPALAALGELSDPGPDGRAGDGGPDGGPVPQVLGDFRIVRELGRGGMGVVYEAEQVSLGRKVALKVLPTAATLDPRRLQRFHNEARAAAQLHHTNIVPVFAVGSEHGVHFYAMQLIEGQTLAAVARGLRAQAAATDSGKARASSGPGAEERTAVHTPRPAAADAGSTAPRGALSSEGGVRNREHVRAVARLGAQAAEALDYAHQLGVVHRDIKPGNLLLDGRGYLWVTDFGLAQFKQPGDATLTQTGDLIGTLRYMSPEQALAQRVPIDHRTDIYGLGATLYELLTLRPPFGGADRQELLRQITFEEPRPLRRLNPAVPAELETIVLKALEKNPAERYATAQELADDLQRFLRDEPIRARRPTLGQRLLKWARRHAAAVVTAALVSLAAAIGLAVSGALIWRQQQLTEEALDERTRALEDARTQRRRALAALDERTRALKEARAQRQRAQAVLVRAIGSDNRRHPLGTPLTPRELSAYCEILDEECTRLLAEKEVSPALRFEAATAYLQIGITLVGGESPGGEGGALAPPYKDVLGKKSRAALHYVRIAEGIFEGLVGEFPDDTRFRKSLCDLYYLEYLCFRRRQRVQDERAAIAKGITTAEQFVTRFPKVRESHRCRARAHGILTGWYFRQGNYVQVLEQGTTILKHQDDWLANIPHETNLDVFLVADEDCGDFVKALLAKGERDLAVKACRHELAIAAFNERLPGHHPKDPFVWHYVRLGYLLSEVGQWRECEQLLRKAISDFKRENGENPPDWARNWPLVRLYRHLARFLVKAGRFEEARRALEQAVEIETAHGHQDQDMQGADRKTDMPGAINELAWLLATCPDRRVRDPARALRLLQKAAEAPPTNGSLHLMLGAAHHGNGNLQAAVEELTRASELLGQADDGRAGFLLATAHYRLGDQVKARQWYDKAAARMDKTQPQDEELRRWARITAHACCPVPDMPRAEELSRFRAEAAALLKIEDTGKK
jgi:serine/threonine protein kinase/Flp pilus assembly protein TadD